VTIFGWDASHYDDPPNAARVIGEGFSFMTHKAGGDGNDQELDEFWSAVEPHRATHLAIDANGDPYYAAADGSRGLLVGAYWVVRPDLHSNPTADADAFLARLDEQCQGWRDAWFILQADCESWGDASGRKKPSKAHIKAFCDRLRVKAPKLTPIVYASNGDYGDSLTGLGYPLWNARYSLSYQTGTASGLYARALAAGSGWADYSGQVPAIWQFTSSATIAGQTTCDANAYRGTLAELTTLVAPGWEVDDMNLTDKVGSEAYPGRTVEDFFNDWWGMRDPLVVGTSKTPALPPSSPLAKLIAMPAQLAQLSAAVAALAGKDLVDEQAIVEGVLAGLDPAKIAAAIPETMAAEVADILAKRLAA
jgi:GH25 family lysozyme M1 (1,4-beta-N-acetylmuramidase)